MSKFFLKNNFYSFTKILFYLFPFFMLLESFFINVYVTLITILVFFVFYFKKIKIKFDNIDYLLFIYFFLGFIASILNIEIIGNFLAVKSFLDFRFLCLFIAIKNLIEHKLVNLKFIFILALSCASFLSLDIIYQHINGSDIFGNHPFDGRYNGTFEHEAIAGSYIQKNFLIAVSVIFLLKTENQNKFLIFFLVSLILGLGIMLSLDRMPFIVYLFIIILLIIFLKKFRILLIFNLLFIFIIFNFLFNNYEVLQGKYYSLSNEFNFKKFKNTPDVKIDKIEKINEAKNESEKFFISGYYKIYKTSYYIWLENPVIGSGTRSFGKMCKNLTINVADITCSTHPHNIYLESLITRGILGMLIFLTIIIIIFFDFRRRLVLKKNNFIINVLFLTILISELWPLRSYGSIFQTVNGSIFWFVLALTNSNKTMIK